MKGRIMGNGIKELRKRAGLTQNELAERTGTRQSWISDIEREHYDIGNVTIRNGLKLARALGCRIEDLLGPHTD